MGNMIIKSEAVDLYKHKVRTHSSENVAIFEIEGQILKWLIDNSMQRVIESGSGSILLNKLVYFISEKLEKINQNLIISRGWYKYGPCYEHGRWGEESLSLAAFGKLEPRKEVITEIAEICKDHVPRFLDSSNRGNFPYNYIEYIYSEHCNFPWLQEYYLSKHKLSHILGALDKQRIEEKEINKAFIDFDKAIINKKYLNKVGIDDGVVEDILEITTLLSDVAINPEEKGIDYFRDIRDYFNENILITFASKNYIKTLRTSGVIYGKVIKEGRERCYKKLVSEIPQKIKFYYSY